MKIILKGSRINKRHPLVKRLLMKMTFIDTIFIDYKDIIAITDLKNLLNKHRLNTPKIFRKYPELLEYFI